MRSILSGAHLHALSLNQSMTKSFCTSDELVWIAGCRGNVTFGVMDSSAHEHEIRAGNGMCQAGGERKDEEEEGEDKEKIFNHGCHSWGS